MCLNAEGPELGLFSADCGNAGGLQLQMTSGRWDRNVFRISKTWFWSLTWFLSTSPCFFFLSLIWSADYREDHLFLDGWLAQYLGGVDQSSAEHSQGPGQQPRYCGDETKTHRERLAHKGQSFDLSSQHFLMLPVVPACCCKRKTRLQT